MKKKTVANKNRLDGTIMDLVKDQLNFLKAPPLTIYDRGGWSITWKAQDIYTIRQKFSDLKSREIVIGAEDLVPIATALLKLSEMLR